MGLVTRKTSSEEEVENSFHPDDKSADGGTRSTSPCPCTCQIRLSHGPKATICSDRGSSDSSGDHMKASPIKLAGILRSGITSVYKDHALATLRWEIDSESTAEAASSADRNFLDHEVGQEFINQRSLELARSHARSEDSRAASRLRKAHFAKDLSTPVDPIKDSNLQPETNNRQNVTFVDSTVGPPPPCSQCKQTGRRKLRRFSSEKLAEVTDGYSADNNFGYQHEQLFKGILDGQRVYVVRREPHEKGKVFSEVDLLRSIQHPNIVNLMGYCDEDNHLALVFAFVCNRCLSFHLDGKNLKCTMQWPHRANLAVQVAEGLAYLHDNSIIHGNVNSSYVFVHRDFTPLIAQFSISRRIADGCEVIDEDRSEDKKSRGYLAPEYTAGGKLSMQQDVYAFGVILFELITGRSAFYRTEKKEIFLGEWGRKTFEEFQPSDDPLSIMLDQRLDSTNFDKRDVLRMMTVASRCTQADPNARPLMREVLEMLTSDVEHQLGPSVSSNVSEVADPQVEKGSRIQDMLHGDIESEGSQTSPNPDTCGDRVQFTVYPDTDAMETERTPTTSDDSEDLTIKKLAGKFLRDLKDSASELNRLIQKVPLMPNGQEIWNDDEIHPFNYYQKRTVVRKSRTIMSAMQPPIPAKSLRNRPPTPGHHLYKNRPKSNLKGERGDSSPPFLPPASPYNTRRFSAVSSGRVPMSPVRVVVTRTYSRRSSGATTASKSGKQVKFSNQRPNQKRNQKPTQRPWPMSILLSHHH